jgi:hypothetical protein
MRTILLAFLVFPTLLSAQTADSLQVKSNKLFIGGYGEVHYNQSLSSEKRYNGNLDVHRMVLLLGYDFSPKTKLFAELEFEHVKEVYVEQIFLSHSVSKYVNVVGGLLLIPMGMINEHHEPTTFNGVERPFIDTYIAPSTWREIGLGINGNILPLAIKYQLYLVNGFKSYDGSGLINGGSGFRSGRQRGAKSIISSPNLSARADYYGIRGLNLGLSGYFGKTQSTLYNGINKNDEMAIARADSSVVGLAMLGADFSFSRSGFDLKGQFYYSSISNSDQYNVLTARNGVNNNLGKSMLGYYAEVGYNVLQTSSSTNYALIPFVRYEGYNTHLSVEESFAKNPAFNVTAITTGFTLKLAKGAAFKADMQFVKAESESKYNKIFNAGIGFEF